MSLFYKSALEKDLPRWRERGWVTPEGAKAILADVEDRTVRISISGVFGMIAATLICLALAAFIAANWDAIGRSTKLALLIGLLWTAYGASIAAHHARWPTVAHAALLIASSGFGGCIMLISQIYHLSGHPPDAVLMWTLGALIGGSLLSSAPTLTLAALLGFIWCEMEYWGFARLEPFDTGAFWGVLAIWCALALSYWRSGWSGGFHIVAIGVSWWVVMLSFRIDGAANYAPVFAPSIAISLAAMGIGAIGGADRRLASRFSGFAPAVTVYAFITAFATLFLWQLDAEIGKGGLWSVGPYAAVLLGFVLATLGWALYQRRAALSWWCYAALIGELTYLYFETLGTLLETAAFFLMAALAVVLIALSAARLRSPSPRLSEASP